MQIISALNLKFGRGLSAAPLKIQATPITVFVGPNNAGKSKILMEINNYCRTGQQNLSNVILNDITFNGMTIAEADTAIAELSVPPGLGEAHAPNTVYLGKFGARHNVPLEMLRNALHNPIFNTGAFCGWFLSLHTMILDGKNRIDLVSYQPAGNLQYPATSLQILFTDDAKREEVRRIIYDAFETYFTIDPTHIGNLKIKLSDRQPRDYVEERGWHAEAIQFHAAAKDILQTSDGIKAFTGMITQIVAGDPRVLLIDEPEAFLHPSLAFKLGKEISQTTASSDKNVFVATHSPYFVMGCVLSGVPVNIVRLTYRNGVATARLLPNESILKFMRHPLLRSTGVLSALFYEFVVVAESDADRAFYQEINERLLRFSPRRGIPNCLFINAQNKQTVPTILKPLRELGIPAAGIVDIDVLKDGGKEWARQIESCFVPNLSHQSLSDLRSAIKKKFDEIGKEMKTAGAEMLPNSDKEAANNLFDQLAEYGLFVVRGGEVESWLKDLKASGHSSSEWLIDIFEKMGEDPTLADYVKPTAGDVWTFVEGIKEWVTDPNKKGIPI